MSYAAEQEIDNAINLTIFIIIALILVLVFLLYYMKKIVPYQRRARYIKREVERSHGSERERWERRLKRHYVRAIPFVGKKIAKRMKKKRRFEN